MTTKTNTTPVPAWLRQHLIDTGIWSADGVTRKAKLRTHTCGLLVLIGLDADLAAFPATVDPTPLTTTGEMLALLGNRDTYDYRPVTRELDGPRRANRITYAPATDTGSVRVLPTHVCDAPPLPHYDLPAATTKELTDEAPY